MKFKALGTAVMLCSCFTLVHAQEPSGLGATAITDRAPNGINVLRRGIVYHGGPVLGTVAGQPVHLYLIFYGNWSGTDSGGPGLLQAFSSSLGGSPYWNILTTYKESNGTTIQNAMNVAGTVTDTGSQGSSLSDSTLQLVVQHWIGNGTFPLDTNAVYHVLASQEIQETSGFCSSYCGFHNHMSYQGQDIKYTFVGNPAGCTAQGGVADCQGDSHNISQSPNNDPGVDAMVSVVAHESEEAVSDPDLNAWYFSNGQENGDKCAYMYGATHPVGNGSDYNVTMGGKNYLIQENWIGPGGASGQKCALSYP